MGVFDITPKFNANRNNSMSNTHTLRGGLFQALLLAVIMFSSLGSYLVVLKWRGQSATVSTWTPVDEIIPFWPTWIWIYLLPYAIGPLLVGLLSRPTFWWFVRRGLVVVGITLLIFVVFPTRIDTSHRGRDRVTGLTAEIYNNVIAIDDPPANAAPSLHVSLTCLLLLALLRDFPRWWPLFAGAIGLVWLSTLVTGQHHLLDVASGILLALAVAFGVNRIQRNAVAHRI
jgi:membrane-associated phospholipid phosphatase